MKSYAVSIGTALAVTAWHRRRIDANASTTSKR